MSVRELLIFAIIEGLVRPSPLAMFLFFVVFLLLYLVAILNKKWEIWEKLQEVLRYIEGFCIIFIYEPIKRVIITLYKWIKRKIKKKLLKK